MMRTTQACCLQVLLALLLAVNPASADNGSSSPSWWERATSSFLRGGGGVEGDSSGAASDTALTATISEHELHRLLNFQCESHDDCPLVHCAGGIGHPPCPELVCYNDRCVPAESTIRGVPAADLVTNDRKYNGDEKESEEVPCGPSTCTNGQVCCNESCGTCTEKGGFCTQQFCDFSYTKCNQGSDCPKDEPYCVEGKCTKEEPEEGFECEDRWGCAQPRCMPDLPCFESECIANRCVSMPVIYSSEDGSSREVECGVSGLECPYVRPLQCKTPPCPYIKCEDYACVRVYPENIPCGPNTCTNGRVCCNESCGICTGKGEMCTQQFCLPYTKCNQSSDCPKDEPYCVEGKCTGEDPEEEECEDRWGCAQPSCMPDHPCFESECIANQCVSKPVIYSSKDGSSREVECGVSGLFCPVMACIRAPCPYIKCEDYACVTVYPEE